MSFPRASGVLLHPTSLPQGSGIGDLGKAAYDFVDFLEGAGQSLWQVLPLGPTGYGDSPYQSFSAFAGNPLLISLESLVEDGLLSAADLVESSKFPVDRVDYGPVIEFKTRMLTKAHASFATHASENDKADYLNFADGTKWWLEDYATFRAIKDQHEGKEWAKWEPFLRDRQNDAMHFFRENHAVEISRHKFWQYLFFKQWLKLAAYANGKGVKIIGDIPIFVAHDSADVWANPHLFHLDKEGQPLLVAGVPPDYFSETGQLWGNPLYRWDLMAKDRYQWWIKRIRATLSLVDIIRLDHFRGFEKYWAVPAGEVTAINGAWQPGPGADFFNVVKQAFANADGDLPIIAEDLGFITEEVDQLRHEFGFPGMYVLQFCFGPGPESDKYKPYSFSPNSVVYTGTHDNDTTMGWFTAENASTLSNEEVLGEREFILKYLGTDGSEINWDLIRVMMASVCNTAIVPLQDVLACGSEARMNVPSRENGNWSWRFQPEQLTLELRARLGELTEIYGRNRARLKKAEAEPQSTEGES